MTDEAKRPGPVKRTLEAGRYRWCGCAKGTDPLCDPERCGTEEGPVAFELLESTTIRLCGCKKSGNPPYCDGTHHRL